MKIELTEEQIMILDWALERAQHDVQVHLDEGFPEDDGYTPEEIEELKKVIHKWEEMENYLNEQRQIGYGGTPGS